nr:MAG TPA: hypothetical protein [Caudoviricetes sp.]
MHPTGRAGGILVLGDHLVEGTAFEPRTAKALEVGHTPVARHQVEREADAMRRGRRSPDGLVEREAAVTGRNANPRGFPLLIGAFHRPGFPQRVEQLRDGHFDIGAVFRRRGIVQAFCSGRGRARKLRHCKMFHDSVCLLFIQCQAITLRLFAGIDSEIAFALFTNRRLTIRAFDPFALQNLQHGILGRQAVVLIPNIPEFLVQFVDLRAQGFGSRLGPLVEFPPLRRRRSLVFELFGALILLTVQECRNTAAGQNSGRDTRQQRHPVHSVLPFQEFDEIKGQDRKPHHAAAEHRRHKVARLGLRVVPVFLPKGGQGHHGRRDDNRSPHRGTAQQGRHQGGASQKDARRKIGVAFVGDFAGQLQHGASQVVEEFFHRSMF